MDATNFGATKIPTISFGQAVKNFYSKCFDFSGRARRSEFWWAQLYIVIATSIFSVIISLISDKLVGLGIALIIIYSIHIFLADLSLTIRRLHDIDKSGWVICVNFIPYIGSLIQLYFCCQDSTIGPNRWGESPKYPILEGSSEEDYENVKLSAWSYIWPFLLLIVPFCFFRLVVDTNRLDDNDIKEFEQIIESDSTLMIDDSDSLGLITDSTDFEVLSDSAETVSSK